MSDTSTAVELLGEWVKACTVEKGGDPVFRLGDHWDLLERSKKHLELGKASVVVTPFDDKVAMAGAKMPKARQIDDLLRILATIRHRFGNTAVTYSLSWGGCALWERDAQAERIAELEVIVEKLSTAHGLVKGNVALTEEQWKLVDGVCKKNVE